MRKLFAAISTGFLLGCRVPVLAHAQMSRMPLAPRSPRVAMLRKQLKNGQAGVLDNFWREVKQRGTPLVETIPGNGKHVLVTFLWRGDHRTRNVVVFSAGSRGAIRFPNSRTKKTFSTNG